MSAEFFSDRHQGKVKRTCAHRPPLSADSLSQVLMQAEQSTASRLHGCLRGFSGTCPHGTGCEIAGCLMVAEWTDDQWSLLLFGSCGIYCHRGSHPVCEERNSMFPISFIREQVWPVRRGCGHCSRGAFLMSGESVLESLTSQTNQTCWVGVISQFLCCAEGSCNGL